jgi:hypothetical protein
MRNDTAKQLASVLDDLTDTDLKLLVAHHNAPGHTATAEQLAHAMGWKDYRAVNVHYGAMAHRVSDLLGWSKPDVDAWVFNLFDWASDGMLDAKGHTRFELTAPVRKALKLRGYIGD